MKSCMHFDESPSGRYASPSDVWGPIVRCSLSVGIVGWVSLGVLFDLYMWE